MIKVTFLGTGTSSGVPVPTCKCEVCRSVDYRDNRLRTSVLVQSATTSVVIDAGPDFRQQILRADLQKLDGIVYTHEHKDHTAGLDDVRPYNYLSGEKVNVPIYARPTVLTQLKKEFAYVFDENPYPGIPLISTNTISNHPFTIGDLTFTPIEVFHHKLPVYGFRVGDFTYITDANFISEEELEKVYGTEILVLNALQKEPHISHFTLAEAIELSEKIGSRQTYFTHISHKLGLHRVVESSLPDKIKIAYDGLTISI